MIELNRDSSTLTIMGVQFSTKENYEATVSAIANNMFEGYTPTIEDVKYYADNHQTAITPVQALSRVRQFKLRERR